MIFFAGIGAAIQRLQKKDTDKQKEKGDESDNSQIPLKVYISVPTLVIGAGNNPKTSFFINIIPAIKGKGWPKGAKLQHALPKQRPYCVKGQHCLNFIENLIAEGKSLWYLEARPIQIDVNFSKAARFRNGVRKKGYHVENLWTFSFVPTEQILFHNMVETCALHEYAIDIEELRKLMSILGMNQCWSKAQCGQQQMKSMIMWVFKRNLPNIRNFGEATITTLEFIRQAFIQSSCPNFLMPNVNMLNSIDSEEAFKIAGDIKVLLDDIRDNPGNILAYIGFNKPGLSTQK